MKNARIKSITHRLFALMMALLLAAGGFMMDAQLVHAETEVVETATTTTTPSTVRLSITVNNGPFNGVTSLEHEGNYSMGQGGETWPFNFNANTPSKNISFTMTPVDGEVGYVFLDTGRREVSAYSADMVAGKTVTVNESMSGWVRYGTSNFQYKQLTGYTLEVTCNSATRGTEDVTFEYIHSSLDIREDRIYAVEYYDCNFTIRLYFTHTDGSTREIVSQDMQKRWYNCSLMERDGTNFSEHPATAADREKFNRMTATDTVTLTSVDTIALVTNHQTLLMCDKEVIEV